MLITRCVLFECTSFGGFLKPSAFGDKPHRLFIYSSRRARDFRDTRGSLAIAAETETQWGQLWRSFGQRRRNRTRESGLREARPIGQKQTASIKHSSIACLPEPCPVFAEAMPAISDGEELPAKAFGQDVGGGPMFQSSEC